MKFTVYAPAFTEKSAGAWILHFLCHKLNELGHNAKLTIYTKDKTTNPNFNTPIGHDSDAIAIYPEIICGNPLQANRVVRYLLFYEGGLQSNKINWGSTDFAVTFSKVYRDDCPVLFYPNPDLDLFCDEGLERDINTFYVGKGYLFGQCEPIDAVEITRSWPESKHELANLLKRSKYFLTYDPASGTNLDAALCGAIPVFLNKPLESSENGELGVFWTTKDAEPYDISGLSDKVRKCQAEFTGNLANVVSLIDEHFRNKMPSCLNLGSGEDLRDDCINADIQAEKNPDWVLDIQNVPWQETIVTRLGTFVVKPGMFDKIIANDVLEHIPDLVKAMTNCKDLLCEGGEFHITVPYDLSFGAWQDPTHVRAFNECSWVYYTDWHWYLNWKDRFYLKELVFNANPDMDVPAEALPYTPRAVDSMSVILTKGTVVK